MADILEQVDHEAATLEEMAARIQMLEIRNEDLLEQARQQNYGEAVSVSESIADLALAIEDIGWMPLGGQNEGNHEIPLIHLKRLSELCRAMATVNPLVKNGILIRTSWIWGDGVKITVNGSTGAGRKRSRNNGLPDSLQRILGTTMAQIELERSAAADGTLFFLVEPGKRKVTRLPFWQVTGAVTENGDTENILYIKRTWDDSITDLDTGLTEGKNTEAWIPTDTLEGPPKTGQIMSVDVDTSGARIVYVPYNRMIGWRWGIPDIFPCIWWSKAYKEFLENCATLTKAYARFAWKVTSASGKGTGRVASQLAAAPQRDPATGKPQGVGASAVLGAGQDLTAIQRSTSVDFKAGSPLAAMVAAGLGVPLHMLTTDIGDAPAASADSLDEPTIRAMEARQNIMDDAIKRICALLKLDVTIVWPDVDPEPLHRLIQAIDMAGRSGTLFSDEWRDLIWQAMGPKWVEKYGNKKAPDLDNLPNILKNLAPLSDKAQAAADQRQIDLAQKKAALTPPSVPGGDQSDPPKQPEPPSYGDHQLRDEGGQAHTD